MEDDFIDKIKLIEVYKNGGFMQVVTDKWLIDYDELDLEQYIKSHDYLDQYFETDDPINNKAKTLDQNLNKFNCHVVRRERMSEKSQYREYPKKCIRCNLDLTFENRFERCKIKLMS